MTDFEVRLTEFGGAQMLTPWVSDLKFRSVDPGGFGSVTFNLSRDLDAREFDQFSEIAVFDAETGEQVGGGRLLNPGRGRTSDGEDVWQMSALGEGMAHSQERKQPYFLIHSEMKDWKQGQSTSINRRWGVGAAPDDNSAGFLLTINQTTVGVNAYTNADFYDLREYKPQTIGGLNYTHREGRTSGNFRLESQLRPVGGSTPFDIEDQGWSTSLQTVNKEVVTNWSSGTTYDQVNLVMIRVNTTSPTIDTEVDFIKVSAINLATIRKGRDGADVLNVPGAYTKGYVLASEAVIDMWSRFCPRFDLANARVDATVHQNVHLVWPDGVNTYDVMQSLIAVEPSFTWAVWEKQSNGKWRAEWRARDTAVRYELAVEDGFDQTGAESDRLTRVWFTGANVEDRYQAFATSEPDPVLAALNLDPTDTLPLGQSLGGSVFDAEAATRAASVISDSKLQAAAARVTVSRKVFDHYTGRWVNPYKILPGYLCRVTGARSRHDTLNSQVVDGAAVFRVASNDYSADTGASQLELNSYTVTEARAIADLMNSVR